MEDLSNFDAINFLHGAYSQMFVLNNFGVNRKKELIRLNRWYTQLSNGYFEYELIRDRAFLVLNRPNQKRVTASKKGLTYMCMFCGHEHIHGLGEGHRVSHCSGGGIILPFIKHVDGTVLHQSDGYIIKDDKL